MTDSLVGVSLADALDLYIGAGKQEDADVVWAWFRANRATLMDASRMHYVTQVWQFDALLDAAQQIGGKR